MQTANYIALFGGMSLFLYGMFQSRDGIQHFAGERLKTIITGMTSNRVKGLVTGAVLTVFLQSSTALTVMLVGIAHSGLITLAQVMPILLGADMGTTLTVQLIAFKIDQYALLVVTIGFVVMLFAKKQRTKFLGTLFFGFGLIFFGMKLMVDAVAPLKDAQSFAAAIKFLGDSPLMSLLIAMVFTAIIHSSAATIGLVISLALAGSMTLQVAVPMVLGANIGTCFTALLAGIGSGATGKRVALAHIFWKVLGVVLLYPFLGPFETLVRVTSSDVARQVANAHTMFNVGIAFIFLPFTNHAVKVVSLAFKADEEKERPFGPIFLDPSGVQAPALAMSYVSREIVRMAHIVDEMLKSTLAAFENRDRDLVDETIRTDDKVDVLDREIKFYLAKVNKSTYTDAQAQRELELVSNASDLEAIGDIISKTVLLDARKYILKGLSFSAEGWAEIAAFHARVVKDFDMALAAYETRDELLARQVIREKEDLAELETKLKQAHLDRLHAGHRESFETSSIHIEFLSNLRRINALSARTAYQILNRRDDDRRIEKTML
ncbi:MAG: Na/Pi cotransporter family protein [Deltaproteobacteria bacterium]|nr:Na/Pi cotransporter family protein [Deltaproteobacteria bacterium]